MTVIGKYYHTLRYLKFKQLYYRLERRYKHPKVNKLSSSRDTVAGNWVSQELYNKKLISHEVACILNQSADIISPQSWNDDRYAKLWLYNLHYFDDLNAVGRMDRLELQKHFIDRWVNENPASVGNGWEPYPISLRVVNWIKAFLSGLDVCDSVYDSLACQADYLSQDLEHHLLGNHLFVNAKALIFAGCFFKGAEADKWLKVGLDIYTRELNEQVLADGGNYELTPMYHVIMLVDLLDLLNLAKAYPNKLSEAFVVETEIVAKRMLKWLDCMSHGDDKISFFNDSAFGIAPENAVVREYAKKLGLEVPRDASSELVVSNLVDSGYVSVKGTDFTLLADLAAVGPDYQPGHAHADTLSFEFSIGSERVFVNSGISEYGVSEERVRQRGTSTHNTVEVNCKNSSEVWSGFRVARRARIVEKIVSDVIDGKVEFSAAHNGYKQIGEGVIHKRSWTVSESEFTFVDELKGKACSSVGYLHLHPNVEVVETSSNKVQLTASTKTVVIAVEGADVALQDSTWHPEFGKVIPNKKLIFNFSGNKAITKVCWY